LIAVAFVALLAIPVDVSAQCGAGSCGIRGVTRSGGPVRRIVRAPVRALFGGVILPRNR
jgi:hypothetical protein